LVWENISIGEVLQGVPNEPWLIPMMAEESLGCSKFKVQASARRDSAANESKQRGIEEVMSG
jgi:hypothetical protein